MKKITLFIVVIAVVVLGYFIFVSGQGNEDLKPSGNGGIVDGNVQEIVLSMQNFNYYPNTVTVKAGLPVRIYLDKSVYGCYRSFNIRALGISKQLPTPKDYVEFTPEEKGTYVFMCSMGMGSGKLIVE
jgi:plastocyanin domain-containing protein